MHEVAKKDSGDDKGNVQNASLEEPVDVAEALAMYQRLMLERSDAAFVADFMVFCWQAVDPGRVAALDLPGDVVDACADQLSLLMRMEDQQDQQDQQRAAPAFWKRYIEWADYAIDFPLDERKRFICEAPGYLEPAFSVFVATGGAEMRSEAMELLAEYSGSGTARAAYVRSVIESRLSSEGSYGHQSVGG
ncbi:hypothetical protein D7Y57_10005 [Stenotrophomonas maltophilia]|jgi:hypothetical protein|nr:hypothetical protein DF40_010050 [Stenotrophomonas maltophilia M30]MBA0456463.1 hypothetical protein [Stenotrophomonas maltophilia]MBN5034758.1 hypothetical protein [Stenotrophomonas maltophilia]MCU1112722.1 hypothetical protein [Stenotrophomonas maltophilia]MCU1178823.1 hypothetical protein [Stenotrophomonas maltophilia]